MANAVSKCEFKTFFDGKRKRPGILPLNIEPNKTRILAFLHKLIAKLYRDNECLRIEQNQQLVVADSLKEKNMRYTTMFLPRFR